MFSHRIVTGIITTALVAITLGGLSPAARAQGLTIQTDEVNINAGKADFGGGVSHTFGHAEGHGTVTWELSTVNGSFVINARVRGTLYWDSLDPGCAGLTISFLRPGTGTTMGSPFAGSTQHAKVCGPGGNAVLPSNKVAVDQSFANADLGFVEIETCVWVNNAQCVPDTIGLNPNFVHVQGPPNFKKHDVNINSGQADFGTGLHAFGGPTGSASVKLTHDSVGQVTGLVDGTLYWDALLASGCSQLIIEFRNSNGTTLSTKTIEKCGPGGNANDAGNKQSVNKSFSNGSLMQILLRVGVLLPDGSFQNVIQDPEVAIQNPQPRHRGRDNGNQRRQEENGAKDRTTLQRLVQQHGHE